MGDGTWDVLRVTMLFLYRNSIVTHTASLFFRLEAELQSVNEMSYAFILSHTYY